MDEIVFFGDASIHINQKGQLGEGEKGNAEGKNYINMGGPAAQLANDTDKKICVFKDCEEKQICGDCSPQSISGPSCSTVMTYEMAGAVIKENRQQEEDNESRVPPAIKKNRPDREPESSQFGAAGCENKKNEKYYRQIGKDKFVGIKKHGLALQHGVVAAIHLQNRRWRKSLNCMSGRVVLSDEAA